MSRHTEESRRNPAASLIDKTVFGGTLLLLGLTAIPYATVDPWWESVFEAAVFVLVILTLIASAINRSIPVNERQLLYPLFAITGFAFLQSITLSHSFGGSALGGVMLARALSADPFETWRFVFKLLAITLVLGLLLRHTSNPERFRLLACLMFIVTLASAIFGLVRTQFPESFLGGSAANQSFGQFENRNHFALLMEMGIGVMLGLALSQWQRRLRFAGCILAGLIMWTALLMTHSRGGVVSLMAEIPFFFLLYSSSRAMSRNEQRHLTSKSLSPLKKVTLTGLLLATVAASVVLIGGDETIYRLRSTTREFASPTEQPPKVDRPQIWQATLKLIKDNPLAGIGFAAYSAAISKYISSSGEFAPQQAHNDYLEVLASGGVVAGILCAWFLLSGVRAIRKRLQIHDSSLAVRCGASAGLFAVGVHSLFDFGSHLTVNALACTALIVLAVKDVAAKPVGI